jgi:CRISPR-associated protein Cas5d
MNKKIFCLEVCGDFACFTRPEMKVERVSYDVPTPSSVRSIFETIIWKPAIKWQVTKIEVLKPIRWVNLRRNEIGSKTPKNMNSLSNFFIEEDRQQRAGLFLRDVAYRFHAYFDCDSSGGPDNTPEKFLGMFERRAIKGQCINQPYLGCREFSADFSLVDLDVAQSNPISDTRDLGWMLYDLDFSNPSEPKPLFFRAQMCDGVINVPHRESPEVRG